MDQYDDYCRRVQLAIDGYERQEWVSTWVIKEHLKESIVLLRELRQERERLKAEVDLLHHNAMQCDHENTDAIIESLRQERATLRAELKSRKIAVAGGCDCPIDSGSTYRCEKGHAIVFDIRRLGG